MAADDLTDLEARAGAQEGIENHPHGFMLIRLVRLVRLLAGRMKQLEDRVAALEGRPR